MLRQLSAVALATAAIPHPRAAHADAIGDFRRGTTVTLALTTVDLGGGPRSNDWHQVTKPAGSLDFALTGTDLGLGVPVTMQLRAAPQSNGRIVYTIDNSFSPGIDIGNRQKLRRVTGRLVVAASRVPGAADHQYGNTRLETVDGTGYLDAYGDWGTRRIAIKQLDLLGGIPDSRLASFVDPGGTLCSDRVRTTRTFVVTLDAAAPVTGTLVDLTSAMTSGVRLPNKVFVRPGQRTTSVDAFVDANFTGTTHLVAAAGGVTRTLDLVVRPHRDCE